MKLDTESMRHETQSHSRQSPEENPTNRAINPAERGLTRGADGKWRIPWGNRSPELRHYYDEEWAHPVHDEHRLYERLVLGGFQAGLSWSTVLSKRDILRAAFADFCVEKVAAYQHDDVERIMTMPGMIRNRRKIEAAIVNARAVLAMRRETPLSELLWGFAEKNHKPWERVEDIPTQTVASQLMARELKRRGCRFVGPVICYAFMRATGMVETRVRGEYRTESGDGEAMLSPTPGKA